MMQIFQKMIMGFLVSYLTLRRFIKIPAKPTLKFSSTKGLRFYASNEMTVGSTKRLIGKRAVGALLIALTQGMFSLSPSYAARIKDIAEIKGVRENILIGYGLVVGLKGTGDSSTEVTSQSLGRLFSKLGLEIQGGNGVKSKNAAAVIVTAKLPPFSRAGKQIDVTVSSIGDAGSLEGGMLLVTPLRAGDQNVYAVAQGLVSLGGVADGNSKNFPTVGRVVRGATVEKDVEINLGNKKSIRLQLNDSDFTTAARVTTLINAQLGGKYATSTDSATVDIVIPFQYESTPVELISIVENIQVNVDVKAKVVLNERTGTVILGQYITLNPVAISHGELAIEIKGEKKSDTKYERVNELKGATSVADLVKALNLLGVTPKDLIAIFQSLREAGALQAEIELM